VIDYTWLMLVWLKGSLDVVYNDSVGGIIWTVCLRHNYLRLNNDMNDKRFVCGLGVCVS